MLVCKVTVFVFGISTFYPAGVAPALFSDLNITSYRSWRRWRPSSECKVYITERLPTKSVRFTLFIAVDALWFERSRRQL